jgi:sortase A
LKRLKESWAIYEGTTETQLSKGVGHYVGSVLPGVEDRSVLSGHRTTVFNRLGELEKGDDIYVKTSARVFTYKVRSFWIVQRSNRNVIRPSDSAVLTLTTCYPFNSLVRTNKAFIVTADLASSVTSTK